MKQHTLLGIAAALTAFVLVVIGALVGQVSQTGAPDSLLIRSLYQPKRRSAHRLHSIPPWKR
jgi:hypothetical protein